MKIRSIYRWLLFAAVLVAVAWFAWKNLTGIEAAELMVRRGPILLSLFLVTAAFLTRFAAWSVLAASLGLHSGLVTSGRGYFLSLLGRYVPGKVGLALVRVEAYSGYPASKVVFATGVELLCAISAALLLALTGSVGAPAAFPYQYKWIALAGLLLMGVFLSPPVLARTARLLMRITGRKEVFSFPPWKVTLGFIGMYIVPGLIHGLGLYVLLASISGLGWEHYLTVTGAYYAASLGGLVAIFAPGGLGVREGLLFLILPMIVPRQDAVLAAVVMRLVTLAAELALAGMFSIIYKVSEKKGTEEKSPG